MTLQKAFAVVILVFGVAVFAAPLPLGLVESAYKVHTYIKFAGDQELASMFRYKLRTLLIVLALGPPLLFAAYILSIGPAYVLIGAGIVNESSLGWIYEPVLRFCSDHGLHGYIEAYIRWWFSFLGVRE